MIRNRSSIRHSVFCDENPVKFDYSRGHGYIRWTCNVYWFVFTSTYNIPFLYMYVGILNKYLRCLPNNCCFLFENKQKTNTHYTWARRVVSGDQPTDKSDQIFLSTLLISRKMHTWPSLNMGIGCNDSNTHKPYLNFFICSMKGKFIDLFYYQLSATFTH